MGTTVLSLHCVFKYYKFNLVDEPPAKRRLIRQHHQDMSSPKPSTSGVSSMRQSCGSTRGSPDLTVEEDLSKSLEFEDISPPPSPTHADQQTLHKQFKPKYLSITQLCMPTELRHCYASSTCSIVSSSRSNTFLYGSIASDPDSMLFCTDQGVLFNKDPRGDSESHLSKFLGQSYV